MMREISKKFLQRSRRKTVLLCLLVMLINIFSILGISMYDNSVKMLKDADDTYTTIGVIEYVGGNYPDSTNMDAISVENINAFDYEAVEQREEFVTWHKEYHMLGFVEGIKLGDYFKCPYTHFSVIRFKVKSVRDNGEYYCMLQENLYSSSAKEGIFFTLKADLLSEGIELKDETEYIACGDLRRLYGTWDFTPVEFSGMAEDVDAAKNIKDFPIVELTDENYLTESPDMKYWNDLMRFYEVQNGSFKVVAIDNLETQTDFYLGVADIVEGRQWTKEEADEGKKVCVVHAGVATHLEKGVGDTVTLNLHYSEDMTNFYGSYSPDTGFTESGEYEIIGIYKPDSTSTSPYIYIPESTISSLPQDQELYQMGNVELKNGTMASFEKATKDLFAKPYRITVYDQGYEKTVAPIYAMQRNSILIMTLCAVCDLVVIFLFATLQISKQYDVASILISMGTGKKKTMEFLLWGAAIIGGIGSLLGAVVGYFVSVVAIKLAYLASVKTYTQDLRFSNLAMGIQKTFEANIRGSVVVCLTVAIVIFAMIMILCYLYGKDVVQKAQNFGGQLRSKKKKEKKEQVVTAAAVPKAHFEYRTILPEMKKYTASGRGRFVFKQAFRGGIKNFRVNILLFLIPMAIALFMTVYTNTLESYHLSLQEVQENTEINAYLTTVKGRSIKLHNVSEDILDYLESSANVESMYENASSYYVPVGKIETLEDGTVNKEKMTELETLAKEIFEVPSSFAFETKVAKLKNCDHIVAADDIARSEEFFGSTAPAITFLPGEGSVFSSVDTDFLREPISVNWSDPIVDGVVTEALMEEFELVLGDMLYIGAVNFEYDSKSGDIVSFYPTMYKIRVVGSYKSVTGEKNIYVPMLDANNDGVYMNMRLSNSVGLEGFRDSLEKLGVSNVGYMGASRISMIIEDKELVQSVNSIQNNISFMTALGFVLFIVIIIIGFIASFLSMRTRREEVAIIRSMGTGKVRTFLMFFLEQFQIGVWGTIAGLLISFLYTGEIGLFQVGIVFLFFLCFMLGSSICIGKMNTKNVLGILSATD